MLRCLGFRTRVVAASGATPNADALVALHAYKSAALVAAFRKAYPNRPIVVVLSGTDVYARRGLRGKAAKTLVLADAIVALQPLAIKRVPAKLRNKAIAVVQSALRVTVGAKRSPRSPVRLCVLGHLRPEKDPLRAAFALRHLKGRPIAVVQAGRMLDPAYRCRIDALQSRDSRYRYLGEVPRSRALRLLASSDALVLSSRVEGGANVASEAVANGIPILASRIDGNVGMLGDDYRGYYPVGSSAALAALIDRFIGDRVFARALRRQIAALAPQVLPQRERDGLARALEIARRNAALRSGRRTPEGRRRT